MKVKPESSGDDMASGEKTCRRLMEAGRVARKYLQNPCATVARVRAYVAPLINDVMGYDSLSMKIERAREIIDTETELVRRKVSTAIRNCQRKSKPARR